MSHPGDDIPLTDPEHGLGDPISMPQTGQAPREFHNASDSSEALFSMYLDRVIEEDKRMVESWKEDTDGLLTFTGLFSAAVAALLAVSIPDIRPNPQNISAFYLAHIYQQSSTQPDGSRPSIPSTLSDPTEPFSPPTLSVWVNGLWISSLVISLSCALMATLIQQWARRYERVAYPRYHPQMRARIRTFYKDGVGKWRIPMAVEALPALLHISLFLFFAGLSVFLFDVHRTIFKTVTALISICVISYACFSLFPVIQKNSIFYTPLSVTFSFYITGIRHLFFLVFFRPRLFRPRIFRPRLFRPQIFPLIYNLIRMLLPSRRPEDNFFSRSMIKTAEKYVFKLNPDIDRRVLLLTFESLDEDTEYEKYFEGLARLCDSDTGKELELKNKFIEPNKEKLSNALIGLMDRALLSKEFVKLRRMITFTKVIEPESTSRLNPSRVLRRVLFGDWHVLLESTEFGLFMQNWANAFYPDMVMSFYVQCVATLTISIVQNRDKRWIQLATINGRPSSGSLHPNEDHGSILLINATHVVRMCVLTYSRSEVTHRDDILKVSRRTLEAVCKLDIRHTLPELQHEFCDLWNKLVTTAQTDQLPHHRSVSVKMLRNIRKLYIDLHDTPRTAFHTTDDWEQVMDNPGFYPKCTENGHRTSSSLPDLQFDAPRTQLDESIPGDMLDPFPQPHSSPPLILPSQPPSSFPVANPYVPAPNPSDMLEQFPEPLPSPSLILPS